ncbi:MAG: RNA-binding protein [Lachnospiraceae bacterium]|nr:RNA-binding protein [Lachnospiraceae bacterium]
MDREEQLLFRHLQDLADTCYSRNVPVYTDFLNLNEQTVFLSKMSEFSHVRTVLDGGYEGAERKIVCFLPAYEEGEPFRPFLPIRIRSSAGKFTVPCTHRDYLGAILNLGIERGKIGDILVGDGQAHVLCMRAMADYVIEQLTSVKRNPVLVGSAEFSDLEKQLVFTEMTGTLASLRMDSLLAFFMKSSRTASAAVLDGERVFVNGRLCTSHSAEPRAGETVSVRGVGKFVFDGVVSSTKKGRLFIKIRKYS